MRKPAHEKSRPSRTPIRLAVLALCAGAGAGSALAQDSAASAPAKPQLVAQAPAQAASAPAAAALAPEPVVQQITVTATKRTTALQKTPVAVTALSSRSLDDARMTTLLDIVHLVPGLEATSQGDHGVTTMTLRGIGNDTAKTEYADPEVALFVNGIYTARPEGAAALMFDMEGVEVLRGPQGTLWGRNSTVGAVNFQTARAQRGQTFGNVETGLGDYNRLGTRGHFNVPLGDSMAIRFAYAHEQHDGYVKYQNPTRYTVAQQQAAWLAADPANTLAQWRPINYNLFVQGGPQYNAQNQTGLRVSLNVHPSSVLNWDISFERFQDRGTPSMNLNQVPRDGQPFWSALIDTAPYLHRDSDNVRSRVDYDLSSDTRLTFLAGYSKFKGSSDFDQDGGQRGAPTSFATGGAGFQQDRTNWSRYKSYSGELELQSTGTKEVDWILGLYYGAEENGIRFDIPIFNGTQEGTLGWQGSFVQPKETVSTSALFGQATWNVTNDWHLTGGARYTHDVRQNINGRGHGWAYQAPAVNGGFAAVPVDPGCDTSGVDLKGGCGFGEGNVNDAKYTGSKGTYLARASYDVSKDTMVYGSVASGYKSGGTQDNGGKYKPETLVSVELGAKFSLMDGAVTFNAAAYALDFKDFQFGAPALAPDGSRFFGFANAKGAKVKGLEFELAAKLSAADRLRLSGAFTKSKLGELVGFSNDYALPACTDRRALANPSLPYNAATNPYVSASCLDVTGNRMPHAPTFSGTLLYEHAFALASGKLTPRTSIHYETASYLSVFNLGEGDRQNAYARVDIGARYTTGTWYTDVFMRNVSDGKIKTSAGGGTAGVFTAQYKPPRTAGMNVGVDF